MAKTKEELNNLKIDYEKISAKLKELSDEELKYVTGGIKLTINDADKSKNTKTFQGVLAA